MHGTRTIYKLWNGHILTYSSWSAYMQTSLELWDSIHCESQKAFILLWYYSVNVRAITVLLEISQIQIISPALNLKFPTILFTPQNVRPGQISLPSQNSKPQIRTGVVLSWLQNGYSQRNKNWTEKINKAATLLGKTFFIFQKVLLGLMRVSVLK